MTGDGGPAARPDEDAPPMQPEVEVDLRGPAVELDPEGQGETEGRAEAEPGDRESGEPEPGIDDGGDGAAGLGVADAGVGGAGVGDAGVGGAGVAGAGVGDVKVAGDGGAGDGDVKVAGASDGAGFAAPLDSDVPDQDPAVRLRRDLEAILLVADQPVTVAALAGVLEYPAGHVEDVLVDLAAEYAGDQRGFVLRAVAGGWRLYTHPASHRAVDGYLRAGTQQRLTQAALETLAVIAYRQPATRAHVAAVRGVNVDGVLRTLQNRGLIAEIGRDEGPGQAVLYGTTPLFLEQLGLNSLDELPPVADYLPEGLDLSDLEESW